MRIESEFSLVGDVLILDAKTKEIVFEKKNSVIASGKKLVMDFLRGEAVEGIKVLAIEDESQEIFRQQPQNFEDISDTRRQFIFFLTENEPPDPPNTLRKLKLVAGNATVTLNTGIDYAAVNINLEKRFNQSLLIYWTVRIV